MREGVSDANPCLVPSPLVDSYGDPVVQVNLENKRDALKEESPRSINQNTAPTRFVPLCSQPHTVVMVPCDESDSESLIDVLETYDLSILSRQAVVISLCGTAVASGDGRGGDGRGGNGRGGDGRGGDGRGGDI